MKEYTDFSYVASEAHPEGIGRLTEPAAFLWLGLLPHLVVDCVTNLLNAVAFECLLEHFGINVKRILSVFEVQVCEALRRVVLEEHVGRVSRLAQYAVLSKGMGYGVTCPLDALEVRAELVHSCGHAVVERHGSLFKHLLVEHHIVALIHLFEEGFIAVFGRPV